MKISMSKTNFNENLKKLEEKYKIYAPKLFPFAGKFSDTDLVRYAEVSTIEEMVFDKKSNFSPKEILLPQTETMFYFTEQEYKEPEIEEKGTLVFLKSCDLHSVKIFDEIYLKNKFSDIYYSQRRDKIKFVIVGCKTGFDSCFCVSMGTNIPENYHMGINIRDNEVQLEILDEELKTNFQGKEKDFEIDKVVINKIELNVPDEINLEDVINLDLWREYDKRCVACGKCNFVCPTCTCTTTQDIFYSENKNTGERRRVWASCHVDGFTDMAGGHEFRKKHGDRMRFKTMHKIGDFKKRFGYHMCVGCGRCDDACPEYISFSNCIKKLTAILGGGEDE
ncbi:MAG: anaerobic sulfite reductase subunit AsrA [Psychrilyobacter sp.]|uniref:anaerobic sulfite reductase subunit AsrA n=1 Tax=Psychrilyobacter sp. TaxID=2586924 RepID=UPI003C7640EC